MPLTDEQVMSFKALYKARFGDELSDEEAREEGTRLVWLMQRVYRPIKLAPPLEELKLTPIKQTKLLPIEAHLLPIRDEDDNDQEVHICR